jgi:hypothetical protein
MYIIDALLYRRHHCVSLCVLVLAIEIGSGQIVVHSLYIVNIIQASNQHT